MPVYDSLFRHAFGSPDTARELAQNLLPQPYVDMIAGAEVTVHPESHVESELKERFTDLLIRFDKPGTGSGRNDSEADQSAADTTARSELYLYVLVEHKSKPDRWAALQLLRYMIGVWSRLKEDKKLDRGHLPEIVPVLLYHGRQRWRRPPEFSTLVRTAEARADHTPQFKPYFVDIGRIPEAELTGGVRTVVGLLFLKYLRRRLDSAAARRLLDAMHREPIDSELREHFGRFYKALLEAKEPEEVQTFLAEAAKRHYHDTEEDVMSYADVLKREGLERGIQEGLREGLEEGRQEGRLQKTREVLIRQLDRKFTLTAADRERIQSTQDPAALDAALDEIVDAESKVAVLAKLDAETR
jgi:predicted transposase/invertase (TIGR01784 family)